MWVKLSPARNIVIWKKGKLVFGAWLPANDVAHDKYSRFWEQSVSTVVTFLVSIVKASYHNYHCFALLLDCTKCLGIWWSWLSRIRTLIMTIYNIIYQQNMKYTHSPIQHFRYHFCYQKRFPISLLLSNVTSWSLWDSQGPSRTPNDKNK